MKKFLALFVIVLVIMSCKNEEKKTEAKAEANKEIAYASFGKEINDNDALRADRMAVHYANMTVGDSVNSKMIAKVDEVCQAKGCWMKLNLENGEQVMVKFKDYGFFMPKDIAGKEVVINGKAFVNEVPVDEQRHYAEDAGKSPEEIAKITEPKKTYSFVADGVLLKEE
ncbi:DUF4920 domain-containing protein [Ichthyenterobacterium magnum]|uniref:Uncharacterized protein DUF4920 n=1 Tax=Ichthyenterobacterium magnum TaxID=1230530 RepID=A0A420DEK3_9FLAO|nr:DUF4920 domain-containing protein [Ichthyenterobacterium magnum]RKE90835.1 uncharacterized protein DUF4920 [Ichthyenterobacterium magnum]